MDEVGELELLYVNRDLEDLERHAEELVDPSLWPTLERVLPQLVAAAEAAARGAEPLQASAAAMQASSVQASAMQAPPVQASGAATKAEFEHASGAVTSASFEQASGAATKNNSKLSPASGAISPASDAISPASASASACSSVGRNATLRRARLAARATRRDDVSAQLGLKGGKALVLYNRVVRPVLLAAGAVIKKAVLLHAYHCLLSEGRLLRSAALEWLLVTKGSKSGSGVLVITVLTSPFPEVDGVRQRFSCAYNCYYCPNEPGQPRSYLRDEPAVRRANQNGFDPVLQFLDRARVLAGNGHPLDKVELLVLGGTWSSYPRAYQEAFVRDLFFAANVAHARDAGARRRARGSLAAEKMLNERAACKVIGLTLETRPDCVDLREIARLRALGCTRVQLGLQHTDDAVLAKVNRGCTTADAHRALRLLKDAAFKVDVHLMPNLPGASVPQDREMFRAMLHDERLQADQWKIYPCEVTPWTVIRKWHEAGTYVPYPESDLVELLIHVKSQVHPWVRLNRVVRDIPAGYIKGGLDNPSLRQDLQAALKARGLRCKCIRCREVGRPDLLPEGRDRDRDEPKPPEPPEPELVSREYRSQGARELFLSFESEDRHTIFAFLRLREPTREPDMLQTFPELRHAALVRELHVYGQLLPTTLSTSLPATIDAPTATQTQTQTQHTGLGRRLMREAERIASDEMDAQAVAVIAGVGARDYYRKLGYHLQGEGEYMVKQLGLHDNPHERYEQRHEQPHEQRHEEPPRPAPALLGAAEPREPLRPATAALIVAAAAALIVATVGAAMLFILRKQTK